MADISKITTPDGTSWDVKDPKARGVELTQAEYDALEQAGEVLSDVDYHITDAQAGAPLATEIAMSTSDNTSVADKLSSLKTIKTGKGNYSGLSGGGWADRVTVAITFDTPMSNNSYVAFAMVNDAYADFPFIRIYPFSRTVNGFTAVCINQSGNSHAISGAFDWVVIG